MTGHRSQSLIRVLVLMPMLPGYESVRKTVSTVVSDANFELVWLDKLLEDWEWLDWLFDSVRACDIVVADPSEHNAFVMFELGVARAERLPTLIMLDSEDSQVSGSLDGSPFLPYSKSDLGEFTQRLRADLPVLSEIARTKIASLPISPDLFQEALLLLSVFRENTNNSVEAVDERAFITRLDHSMSQGTFIPAFAGTRLGQVSLLAAIIRSSRMVETMAAIRDWVEQRASD